MTEARTQGTLLPESESRAWLAEAGIPVTRSRVATSLEAAIAAAEEIGFPVVLKAIAPDLVHKSDVGGVRLNLETPAAVAAAYPELVAGVGSHGITLAGVLVEEMAARGLEVIVGLTRDPQFGRIVMVGLGGVLVELYGDVAFGAVPLSRSDACLLIDSLKARPLFGAYRGQPAIDLDALVDVILKIGGRGGLAERRPEIVELDLNPVFLYPGGLKVADVKILVERTKDDRRVLTAAGAGSVAERRDALDSAPEATSATAGSLGVRHTASGGVLDLFQTVFHPKAIAVVGASTDPYQIGGRVIRNLRAFGFPGPIYPIHPTASEILGLRAYPTVLDVPGPIDRAYVTVPTRAVVGVIEQCGQKGIKVAQVITAGFGEAGPHGQALEAELVAQAQRSGVRLIGPNCVGTYCPSGKLTINVDAPTEIGNVAFASQSGGLSHDVILRGAARGLRFSKVLSAGNCIDLDLPDILEYLALDDETALVGLYVEGVRDGERFRRLLAETTRRKPVVVLKGGQTDLGERAVAGHTGRLAGNAAIWRAVLAQSGALFADDLEQLIDLLVGLRFLPLPQGRSVALVGNGGGATVTASDACDRFGLSLPDFDPETQQRLAALGLPPGASLKNPVDAPMGTLRLNEGQVFQSILGILLEDSRIDAVVVHLNLIAVLSMADFDVSAGYLEGMVSAVAEAGHTRKPLILTLRSSGMPQHEELRWREQQRATAAGVPVYPDIPAAAAVLAKLASYREYLVRT
ncbi:MAG: acetate--CoA ligase family protein [Chloroflexi bacterium]|nr:acetate--CoA ligase family protein [Chloroflexota bacterium]